MNHTRHVGIFWDSENCAPRSTTPGLGHSIARNIRDIALRYGSITTFKAYSQLSDLAKSSTLRSELQSSGVTLVDCPHNGKKYVVDTMMIVDMMSYIMDTSAPVTIILISGDGDFQYPVATLRQRHHRVVVVAPPPVSPGLLQQVSEVLLWERDVLGKVVEIPSQRLPASYNHADPQRAPLENDFETSHIPQGPTTSVMQMSTDHRESSKTPPRQTSAASSFQPSPTVNGSGTQPRPVIKTSGNSGIICHSRHQTPNSARTLVDMDSARLSVKQETDGEITPHATPKQINSGLRLRESTPQSPSSAASFNTARTSSDLGTLSSSNVYGKSPTPPSGDMSLRRSKTEPTPGKFDALFSRSAPLATEQSPNERDSSTQDPFIRPSTADPLMRTPTEDSFSDASPSQDESSFAQPVVSFAASRTNYHSSVEISLPSYNPDRATASTSAPAHFRTLIQLLEDLHRDGTERPLRSNIAIALKARNPNVYRDAGAERFKQYASMAESAGLVHLGGAEGSAWISLHPHWQFKGPGT